MNSLTGEDKYPWHMACKDDVNIQTGESRLNNWHKGKHNTFWASKLGGCSNSMPQKHPKVFNIGIPFMVPVARFLLRSLDVLSRQVTQRRDTKKRHNITCSLLCNIGSQSPFRHSKIGGNIKDHYHHCYSNHQHQTQNQGSTQDLRSNSIMIQELNSSSVGVQNSKPRRPL